VKWPNVMVDLETMGLPPDGAILRVGMVPFSLEAGAEAIAPREQWLDIGLNPTNNVLAGRSLDSAMVRWWGSQPKEVWDAVRAQPMAGTAAELAERVTAWMGENLSEGADLWARPPHFDLALLFNLLGRQLCPSSGPLRNVMDHRMVTRLIGELGMPGPDPGLRGPAHVASEDAAWQALEVICLVRELRSLLRS
jgi:3' exoribonuclease, RNase T-like